MEVIELNMTVKKGVSEKELGHALWELLWPLERDNRILRDRFIIARRDERVSLRVSSPLVSSLTRSGRFWLPRDIATTAAKLNTLLTAPIKAQHIGIDPEHERRFGRAKAPFYVLFYAWDRLSMLCDGETLRSIPSYRISKLTLRTRGDLFSFHREYQRVWWMWIDTGGGEAFAIRQLQNPNSPLSRKGRNLCAEIESQTGTKTFFYLENLRRWSKKQDRTRLCPITKKPWLIKGKTHDDRVAFRSEKARLVSCLSNNAY